MPTDRIRVLLIAEACNPQWTSVPLVGWSHGRAIADLSDALRASPRPTGPARLGAGWTEGRDFRAIDSEAGARPIYRLATWLRGGRQTGWTTSTALGAAAYPYFEHLLWRRFGREICQKRFDVVHRLTPLSPTAPSWLASRCRAAGVPFVLGPLNGGVPWPPGFDPARRQEREWLSYVRDAYRLLPGYWPTRRDASAILIGSRDTWNQMPRCFHGKCFYLPENAIDPQRFPLQRDRIAQKPIRVIFIGRLVPYKGADMLLEAAAPILQSGAMTLQIIGDGPQLPQLRRVIDRENIAAAVQLIGWTEHEQLRRYLAQADVLAFPSVREFGGAVVLEAMAMGVTPIVVNYGGPAELVTPSCGYLVPIGPPQQIISHFRQVLGTLAQDPQPLGSLGAAAQERVRRHFTWQAKARRVIEIYQWLCAPGTPKPHWPMPTPDDSSQD